MCQWSNRMRQSGYVPAHPAPTSRGGSNHVLAAARQRKEAEAYQEKYRTCIGYRYPKDAPKSCCPNTSMEQEQLLHCMVH